MLLSRICLLLSLIFIRSVDGAVSKSTPVKFHNQKSFGKRKVHGSNTIPTPVKTAIVITNRLKVLLDESADHKVPPASLAKLATLYILFQCLKNGSITLRTKFKVSKNASLQIPSKLGLLPGSTISVLDCICALTVKSANDVAVVVAEGIAGSTEKFCRLMNQMAVRVGMKNTNFKNPSGLFEPGQMTTARDLAMLGLALCRDFPEYLHYLSMKAFKFGQNTYPTHCKILHWCSAVDAAKTGYVRQSGFNLFVTTENHLTKERVIVVVMGWNAPKQRDMYAARLLSTYTRPRSGVGRLPMMRQIRASFYAQVGNQSLLGTPAITSKGQRPIPSAPVKSIDIVQQDDEVELTAEELDKWYKDDVVVETEAPVEIGAPQM
ncbi:MAG: D-alanyl-D-alanine carboxypeptidase [Holosporales bacterium]|jgi:D-alanyl-D-alanine carboxypeptidase|nr:D-alanyl-D-alanine carboxypeptidase [Holosporales bacterium]